MFANQGGFVSPEDRDKWARNAQGALAFYEPGSQGELECLRRFVNKIVELEQRSSPPQLSLCTEEIAELNEGVCSLAIQMIQPCQRLG